MMSEKKFDFKEFNANAFKHIDEYRDGFLPVAGVKTSLLYGDLAKVDNPFFTVIIPTYNREDLFAEALFSVINQVEIVATWDILIVDNTPLNEYGTTPALEIVREIGDERVLFYHNEENIGPGYNWNRGVELARGEWVVFLHDDDLADSRALQNLERIICSYKNRDKLAYIQARAIEFSDNYLTELQKSKWKRIPVRLTRNGALVFGHSQTGNPSCCTCIRRKVYIQYGGVNYEYGLTADAILGYKIMKEYVVIRSDVILGGWRWLENETLNPSTLIDLVETDYLFAQYRYKQGILSKLWGTLFEDVLHELNVESKKLIAKQNCVSINDVAFFQVKRKGLYTCRYYLYLLLRTIYKCVIRLSAICN